MLRATPSGCVGSSTTSPSVTIQAVPSVVTLASRGRRNTSRTTRPAGSAVTCAALKVLLVSEASAERSMSALPSKTSQSVSARRNTAAAVGALNGKTSRRASPWRTNSSATLLGSPTTASAWPVPGKVGRTARAAGAGSAGALCRDGGACCGGGSAVGAATASGGGALALRRAAAQPAAVSRRAGRSAVAMAARWLSGGAGRSGLPEPARASPAPVARCRRA